MDAALAAHGIELPDRQLSCAPASSEDGRAYLAAMAAAANFAWANRQAIVHAVREAVRTVLGGDAAGGTRQVYDVAHNVAKIAEEVAFAYKDVDAVVGVVTRAGLATTIAELQPIGVVKG